MPTFPSYNPVSGELLGTFPVTSPEDVLCVVERAREASERWRGVPTAERTEALKRLKQILGEEVERLAETMVLEIGKPLQDAFGADILPSLQALDWLIQHAPKLLQPRSLPGSRSARLHPEPFGVVGVIGTWNYPLFLNLASIAWAVFAGNAVIFKPSELATASGLMLAGCCERAGLPVFVIPGDGSTGRALCRAGCDKIAFTGGVMTGRAILAELAKTGTPAVMELSGNDAFVVCSDADPALAAQSAVWGRICNAGQTCASPQRLYVVKEQYDIFLLEAEKILAQLSPGRDYGPLRTKALRLRVEELVRDAESQGARLLSGGRIPDGPGFFYPPTLLADCSPQMRLASEDFFGPVLAVYRVQDEAEAIRLTNASDMALTASVWTRDARRGQEIAHQLRVGMVAINDILLDAGNPSLPFGGFRASGFGKQRGAAGLEEFVQWKVIAPHASGGTRRHLFPYRPATLPILRGLTALRTARTLPQKFVALRELIEAARSWGKEEDA